MSLIVEDLSKSYGEKVVVNHISFSLTHPGVYAFLGTNGAGKTTSIRMMLSMLKRDTGSVKWKGEELDPLKVDVGYLAEERGLYPKYTLMDQLLYFARLKNVPKDVAKKLIEGWAEKLEVTEYLYPKAEGRGKKSKPMMADQLSKGNQQKIQLMAALISNPELIILDEPLSGLDPVNSDLFKGIIREQIEQGKYLVMSSHQMSVIEEFCEDITILHHGNAVLSGNLNEIKKSYGRVNVMVKCEGDIDPILAEQQITVVNKTPDGYHLKVTGDAMANRLLKTLTAKEIPVIRFEMREPTLHEIFIEKAGE